MSLNVFTPFWSAPSAAEKRRQHFSQPGSGVVFLSGTDLLMTHPGCILITLLLEALLQLTISGCLKMNESSNDLMCNSEGTTSFSIEEGVSLSWGCESGCTACELLQFNLAPDPSPHVPSEG